MKAKDSIEKRFLEARVELVSKLKIISDFPGEWNSEKYGDGYEFANLREFGPGDNLSEIHFPTLAHSGEYYITERLAERSLNTAILVDISGSMSGYPKSEIRRNVVGLLAFSALQMGSSVGLCLFSNTIEQLLPARMGKRQFDMIIDLILSLEYEDSQTKKETDVIQALEKIPNLLAAQSFIPVISDFFDKNLEDKLASSRFLRGKHDFIPIIIRDPFWEKDLFSLNTSARVSLEDSESGRGGEAWLNPKKIREIQRETEARFKKLEGDFKLLGLDFMVLDSPSIDDCHRILSNFFQDRRRTRR